MTILRHVGIVVTDMERSIKFYNKFFGFKIMIVVVGGKNENKEC